MRESKEKKGNVAKGVQLTLSFYLGGKPGKGKLGSFLPDEFMLSIYYISGSVRQHQCLCKSNEAKLYK